MNGFNFKQNQAPMAFNFSQPTFQTQNEKKICYLKIKITGQNLYLFIDGYTKLLSIRNDSNKYKNLNEIKGFICNEILKDMYFLPKVNENISDIYNKLTFNGDFNQVINEINNNFDKFINIMPTITLSLN